MTDPDSDSDSDTDMHGLGQFAAQLLLLGFLVGGIGLFGDAGFGSLMRALTDIDCFIHEIPELFLVFFFSDLF